MYHLGSGLGVQPQRRTRTKFIFVDGTTKDAECVIDWDPGPVARAMSVFPRILTDIPAFSDVAVLIAIKLASGHGTLLCHQHQSS